MPGAIEFVEIGCPKGAAHGTPHGRIRQNFPDRGDLRAELGLAVTLIGGFGSRGSGSAIVNLPGIKSSPDVEGQGVDNAPLILSEEGPDPLPAARVEGALTLAGKTPVERDLVIIGVGFIGAVGYAHG